jgi:2-isopropylmalate synthase
MHDLEHDYIYNWNRLKKVAPLSRNPFALLDETLRDGLQSPSVRSPSIEERIEILHLMEDLGIESANIGLPGAGPHVVEHVTALAAEIVRAGMKISPNCAARTVIADIQPVIDISEKCGIAIEAACFLGSSPLRQYTEGWEMDRLLRLTERGVGFAAEHGLPVMYVTEDTTRARPEDLRRLYTAAVEAGARRVCVADTVGHATPEGARNLIRFVREVVDATGEEVKVDWHGHKDRGLSVMNSLAAASAGADRLHGTGLGIGERVGNTPIDHLLVNMQLLGWIDRNLTALPRYCESVSRATGVSIPDNYPILGRDAFRTGTGVHAAAIIKARDKGDDWLADRVYSAVPASLIGRRQEIELGPMCGRSNVIFWLRQRGIEPTDELVDAVFARAKASVWTLDEPDILEVCREFGVTLPAS